VDTHPVAVNNYPNVTSVQSVPLYGKWCFNCLFKQIAICLNKQLKHHFLMSSLGLRTIILEHVIV